MAWIAQEYRRGVLYRQVWKRPVSKVAKDYGVSNVALAKIAKKLGVPLPPPGFWARLRAGQKVEAPPLPPLEPHQQSTVSAERWVPDEVKPVYTPTPEEVTRERAEREARAAKQRKAEEDHAARLKQLDRHLEGRRRAREIEQYVADVRRVVDEEKCEMPVGSWLEAWLRWCEAVAYDVDPISPMRREMSALRAVDKTKGPDA